MVKVSQASESTHFKIFTVLVLNRIKEMSKLCLRPQWPFFIITWSKPIMNFVGNDNTHKPIKSPIVQAVVEIMKPFFERLSSPDFLAAVENCRRQNVDESFHHLVWQLTLKDIFTSAIQTKCALFMALLYYLMKGHYANLGNFICLNKSGKLISFKFILIITKYQLLKH